MKRWKVTFGLFLLLLALATTVDYVETREEKVELEGKRVIFTQPRGKKSTLATMPQKITL